jgi:lysophospholipase L1-like esterase
MSALFDESEKHSDYTRTISNPGGDNEIIMFKSCFPNSNLEGNPDDEPEDQGDDMNVANAKFIYKDILKYFRTRPDKLFIIVTAPPVQDNTFADNARGFNNWLVNDYLRNYELNNVAVFDFYNILTGPDNHHRFADSQIQHGTAGRRNTLYYPSDDDHPSEAGSMKATEEFVPWLNVMVNCWKGNGECP